MMKAIIIDDEQHCIDRLCRLLIKQPECPVEIAGSFLTAEEGIAAIQQLSPRLVFLDIQLQDKTGFDVLNKLDNIGFEIIFTTAYDQYAVKAFKVSALDYLLKPVDADDLQQALQKLTAKESKSETAGKLEVLLHNLKNLQGYNKRICVPTVNGFVFLQVNDIIRCQSEGNYTRFFLKDKQKLLVAKTLKEFEELLVEYNFFRVHNSHLVNLLYIKSYQKGKGGSVTLSDDSTIEVSTRRKDEFLKKIADQ